MKYSEMVKFLNDNDILVIQPVIANEVECQLQNDIPEDEFENICEQIYKELLDCIEEPYLWQMVNDELVKRGYKN